MVVLLYIYALPRRIFFLCLSRVQNRIGVPIFLTKHLHFSFPRASIMSTPPDGGPPRPPPPFNPRSNDARHPQPPVVTNPDGTERVFVRKAVQRRTIDYTANNLIAAANRAHDSSVSKNPIRDDPFIKPTSGAMLDFSPSWCLRHQPASSFALKFVHVSANKIKTPINRGKY